MSCLKLKLICFSPTRTTRKIMDSIADGIGAKEVQVIDVTRTEEVPDCYGCDDNDLVIIGAPVYAGRLPKTAVERFSRLESAGVPAVLVVTYGNRDYEDALLELKDLAETAGLKPIAGASFIGEHSYSTVKTPIAVSRPDMQDLEKARKFGKAVAGKLDNGCLEECSDIEVPGNRPYKELMDRPPAAPVSNDSCELCGSCERVCPTDAIRVGAMVETDATRCLLCCACVKVCAFDARIMEVPRILEISRWLAENYSVRKEPEVYL